MTLLELIAILAVIGGLAWGIYSSAGSGWLAMLKSGALGAGKGFLIYALLLICILIPLSLGFAYRPTHPRCRKGSCGDKDFRYLYLDSPAPPEDAAIEEKCGGKLVRCACGDRYIRSDRERRFYEVRADGTLIPFMHYRFAGRWRKEKR